MNCTFKFYFVIKIGTKDTNASLIVLYPLFILFWRAGDTLNQFIKSFCGYQRFFVQFSVLRNWAEVLKSGGKMSGLYKIDPDGLGEFEVFCDQKTAGGGWTVFQRRQDGSVNFYRGWNDYKLGFGNLNGEFWLGLDKIHRLTASKNKKLRVDLEATAGTILLAEYSSFAVANEKAKYQLTVGGYSGRILLK